TTLLSLVLVSCGTKWDLPTTGNSDDNTFGAGDTTYIRISPDWSGANGYTFANPWDVIVGRDGYIFVANHTPPGIRVLDGAGNMITTDAYGNDFTPLSELSRSPYAISQDSRLNLFITDSSNQVWVWNQYAKNVGIRTLVTAIQFDNDGWVSDLDSLADIFTAYGTATEQHMDSIVTTTTGLDEWLGVRPFWDGNSTADSLNAAHYYLGADTTRFVSVTAGPDGSDFCYVADAASDAILKMSYRRAALALTNEDQLLFLYRGKISARTASHGTGNGTVNDPKGMTVDAEGGLYYAQWGEIFGVHKIGGSTVFDLGVNPIMDLNRFAQPSDVAVDAMGNIYVADTDHHQIQQFTRNGDFNFYVGVSKVRIDTTLIDSTLSDTGWVFTEMDTIVEKYSADILNQPRGVAVDANGVVYIADTGNDRIMRFKLSTDFDYDQPE
ncbi:MAG: NHL repeat-containing protein, partial [Candidatus Marinimicrobia bacterium]|nr:NHL repeat-containing protein [Candidatus Neomarinimicrobiota bacterium]